MAQRGGVLSAHLRFAPKVLSPQITPGSADVLLSFAAAEATHAASRRAGADEYRPSGATAEEAAGAA